MESGTDLASKQTLQRNNAPFTAPVRFRRVALFRVTLTLLLSVYWLSMFTGTHIPKIPSGLEGVSDKSLHFGAYFGLSVLLLAWQSTRRTVRWRTILKIWILIAAYGAFDEITQKYFGRDSDIQDFVADVGGMTLGLMLAWPITSRLLRFNERTGSAVK